MAKVSLDVDKQLLCISEVSPCVLLYSFAFNSGALFVVLLSFVLGVSCNAGTRGK